MDELIKRLEALLGPGGVLVGEDVRSRAAGVWRSDPIGAGAIVRPRETEEVSAILALCHERGQSVVTHGGLTGLVHGADTGGADLVLSTERMIRIEEIDPVDRTARVQAGVVLQTLQDAVAEHDLIFPLDLGRAAAAGSAAISPPTQVAIASCAMA